MTIKDLPILSSVQAHWLNSKPLDNGLSAAVQSTEFYKETRQIKQEWWKHNQNKLAYLLKFHSGSQAIISEAATEEFGQEIVNNAYRYMTSIAGRSNIHPVALQLAAIAWFVDQMIDIEKTKELNKWTWEDKK